ncbi:hypothetical protein RF11_05351 [Thelohanellus kitauei]|uniref:Uncharacterized protein n=1 Tax=Thelohanellus kitauei TaxID=669202 RepID=A0A0C2NAZ6_THEKT|nr:hypothetical protein RF11_05351 [Thelohanellus kitauei]
MLSLILLYLVFSSFHQESISNAPEQQRETKRQVVEPKTETKKETPEETKKETPKEEKIETAEEKKAKESDAEKTAPVKPEEDPWKDVKHGEKSKLKEAIKKRKEYKYLKEDYKPIKYAHIKVDGKDMLVFRMEGKSKQAGKVLYAKVQLDKDQKSREKYTIVGVSDTSPFTT